MGGAIIKLLKNLKFRRQITMKKKLVLSVAIVLLVVMIATVCVACTPSQKSVIKKFESKGYKLIVGDAEAKVVNLTKVESLTSVKSITITWYENEEDAKKTEEAFKSEDGKQFMKRKGNAIAIGDEDSIKLF